MILLPAAREERLMFERYTEEARRTLFFARYEASQLGALSIEPEHLLLGLLREANAASPFLRRLPDIRNELAHPPAARKTSTGVEIPFAPPVKRALQTAAEEADRLAHAHIGPEHLLLALLNDPMTKAGAALSRHGLVADALRKEIREQRPLAQPGPPIAVSRANSSPHMRRQDALRQLEAAVAFMSNYGDQYAHSDEARRIVAQMLENLEALKRHLPES
jgi:ATP-dependent Clp protease ATP-binding subunit ClpC